MLERERKVRLNPAALEKAIAPFRSAPNQWQQIESGLEDTFIHLMDQTHTQDAAA